VIQNRSHVLSAPRRACRRRGNDGARFGVGRHAPDRVRDMATELASWTSGELAGQLAAPLPGPHTAPDQPPASA
jgi:hypothetical protein